MSGPRGVNTAPNYHCSGHNQYTCAILTTASKSCDVLLLQQCSSTVSDINKIAKQLCYKSWAKSVTNSAPHVYMHLS